MQNFVLKGDICYSTSLKELNTAPDAYLVCLDGKSAGVFDVLPEQYQDFRLIDCTDKLILPGLVDLHTHAPQFPNRALGMDLELIEWLNTYTFPEETKYADLAFAEEAYRIFVQALQRSPNTRSVIFATPHVPATVLLMNLLEASGLVTMVGKVNMDRNAPEPLCEASADASLGDTRTWLSEVMGQYQRTSPILTPRFIPSCSDELMAGLGEIQREFSFPVQSHLSENPREIDWVRELVPDAETYGHAYYRHGLFGGHVPTVMAHCVWPTAEEFALIQKQQVFVAHCPQSNMNLASGIAPVRRYLDAEIPVGLGSDVSGGVHLSMFRAIQDAIASSKLYWRLIDPEAAPLSLEEGFYLATLGGGRFFGQVGSFEPGFEFDALVLDDQAISDAGTHAIPDRLARAVYLSDTRHLERKFVGGLEILFA